MTRSATSSAPYEVNFARSKAIHGSRSKTRETLHPSWIERSTAPFDYSQDSDQPIQIPKSTTASKAPLWTPLPGPQTSARDSLADETLFGGAAGGGKSDWLLGTALTQH